MTKRPTRLGLTGLGLLASALICAVMTPEAGAQVARTFEAELLVTDTDEAGEPTQRALSFRGVLQGVPRGTQVDIRFALKGNRQHIRWYRAIVGPNGRFDGENLPEFSRPFGPGVYEVECWFKMRGQNRRVRDWFRLNRGFTNRHEAVVGRVLLSVGDSKDHERFVESTRDALRGFLDRVERNFALVDVWLQARKTAKDKAWKRLAAKHRETNAVLVREFYSWRRRWCAVPMETERTELEQIKDESEKLCSFVTKGVDPATIKTRRKALRGRIKALRKALGMADRKPAPRPPKAVGRAGPVMPGAAKAKEAAKDEEAAKAKEAAKDEEAAKAGKRRRRWWKLG